MKDNIVDFTKYGEKPIDMTVRMNGRVQLKTG